MRRDDETTASQLHVLLTSLGYSLNLRTILRCRTSLGWTFRGSAYCQLIHDVNKEKRLDFARAHSSDNFANMIFTDECSVQLETHRRRCCRKEGEPPKNKPQYALVILTRDDITFLIGQSIQSKFTYGLALACVGEQGFVFLKVSK